MNERFGYPGTTATAAKAQLRFRQFHSLVKSLRCRSSTHERTNLIIVDLDNVVCSVRIVVADIRVQQNVWIVVDANRDTSGEFARVERVLN